MGSCKTKPFSVVYAPPYTCLRLFGGYVFIAEMNQADRFKGGTDESTHC